MLKQENKATYTEQEAVEIALKERHTTVLLTSEGKIYYSYCSNDKLQEHDVHAERVFLKESNNLKSISYLYIKNSPCAECSSVLIKSYKMYPDKPKIYIGRIYNLDNTKDKEGLKHLLLEGFEIEVWKSLNEKLKCQKLNGEVREEKKNNIRAKMTSIYLQDLKDNIKKHHPTNVLTVKKIVISILVVVVFICIL